MNQRFASLMALCALMAPSIPAGRRERRSGGVKSAKKYRSAGGKTYRRRQKQSR